MLRNPGLRKSVEQPVLDLNFAASQIGSNGAPDSRIDFNRGNNAWFVDSDGLVKRSPHNLLQQSQTFDTTWSQTGCSVTANSVNAPDATLTGYKLIKNAAFGFASLSQNVTLTVTAGRATATVYAKAGERDKVALREGAITGGYAAFDLTNGTILDETNINEASITSVGNGWFRILIDVTLSSGTTFGARIVPLPDSYTSGSVTASFSDDGTSGVYIWGSQVSEHSYDLLPVDNPYLKTEGSAVYAARLDHDPTWFMSAAQEQNLLQYSEMLDDSGWTKLGGLLQVTANAEEAPDGTTTAEYIFANSPSGQFPQVHQDFDAKNGATHTLSFYAKAAERDVIKANLSETDGTFVSNIILETGISTTEWTRFSATFTASSDAHRVVFLIGDGAQTWSGSQGLYLWGVQVEVGSTAGTYHRTEGAPYYGEGATPKGLLIEEARTNLLQQSETFDTTWTDTGCSITADAVLAPSGAVTGDKLIKDAAFGFASLSQNVTLSSAGGTAIMTLYAKAGERDKIALREGAVTGGYAAFDLTNGTVLDENNINDSSITPAGNGWFRILIDVTLSSGTNYGGRIVPLPDSYTSGSVTASFSDDGTSGVYIWGSQIEEGSFATSYIETIASTATRNADVATMGPTTGGTELVTNGTYDTDTTGWAVEFGCTISQNSGSLRVTAISDGVGAKTAVQTISNFVVGRRYRVSYLMVGNSVSGSLQSRLRIRDGGTNVAEVYPVTNGQTRTVDFTATKTTLNIQLRWDGLSDTVIGDYVDFDNVSLRELYPFEQYNPAEGTLYSLSSCTGNDTHTVLSMHADSFDNYFSHTYRFGNSLRNFSKGGGSTELQTSEAVTLSNRNEIATTYDGTSMNMSANGSDETTGALGADIVGIHEIAFGLRYTANQYSGHIERVQYFPRALPKVTLQSLTSD